MSKYKPVPVAMAQDIANRCEKDVVVVIAIDHAHQLTHSTTFGRTPSDKDIAATLGDFLTRSCGHDLSKATIFEDFRLPSEAAKWKAQRDGLLAACEALAQREFAGHNATCICCGNTSHKGHADSCDLIKAKAAIASAKGQSCPPT